jgi:hypothetical protein
VPGHIVGHPVSRIVAKAAGVPTGNVFAVLDVLQRIGRTDRAGYVAVETEYPVEEVNRIIAAMAMPDCGIIVDGALAAEWVLRRRTPEPPGVSTKRWRRMQDARREAANGPPTAPTVPLVPLVNKIRGLKEKAALPYVYVRIKIRILILP